MTYQEIMQAQKNKAIFPEFVLDYQYWPKLKKANIEGWKPGGKGRYLDFL